MPFVSYVTVVVVLIASTLGLSPPSAGPEPGEAGGPGGPVESDETVTLLTGDRVHAKRSASGWQVAVEPARRAQPVGFSKYPVRRGRSVDWYVIPSDAARLVRAGRLDRELFNVTGLIRQGYDDRRTASLPLLLEYPALKFLAVKSDKRTLTSDWRSLTGRSKVWLNAKVHAQLDVSVAQIGAPAAWRSGLTGKGVKVAVLDTGYDPAHPDLAGNVLSSRDFSGKGNVVDGNGHGTHVASIVAGKGSASAGRYQGVAPDVSLVIGKVLDDSGNGQLDDVLAGMRWAASEVGADVVNLSLGGPVTDGTDPLSRAVDKLTDEHGTLFVVAAGNEGRPTSVTSPAAAGSALAVGNLTKSGGLHETSSQGPRLTDGAVKPEIAAPGTAIVAARAAGTDLGEPVGDDYTRLSGTSMAAPHVAGAAALLVQQQPAWRPAELKAALVSTASPLEAGVFAAGGGLVDVARATTQPVRVEPATVNGYLRWPDATPVERRITYHNESAKAVTLALALTTPGLAELSADQVTVPANGHADVTLTMAARAGRAGMYGGILTAKDAGGEVRLRTPVSVNQEPEMYDLTVRVRDRAGHTPTRSEVLLTDPETGAEATAADGDRLRLPAGRYAVAGIIVTPRLGAEPSVTSIAHPSLRLDRDTSLDIDARDAKPIRIRLDGSAVNNGDWAPHVFTRVKGLDWPHAYIIPVDARFHPVYVWAPPGASSPDFAFAQRASLTEPLVELSARRPQRFDVDADWLAGSPEPAGTWNVGTVHAGSGTPEDLSRTDARGKLVVIDVADGTAYNEVYQRIRAIKAAGGVLVAIQVTGPESLASAETPAALPSLRLHGETGRRFAAAVRAGEAEAALVIRPASSYRDELFFPSTGRLPGDVTYRVRSQDLAAVRTTYHGYPGQDWAPTSSAAAAFFGTSVDTFFWRSAVPVGVRSERFSPGAWGLSISGVCGHSERGLRLAAGDHRTVEWNAAVRGPGFGGTRWDEQGAVVPWAFRDSGGLDVELPLYADGAGRPCRPSTGPETAGTTRLYRDGQPVGEVEQPGKARFEVPAAAATYRLETTVTREGQYWWPLSTRISAAWTFRSAAAPGRTPLPLLAVRYHPDVDQYNALPGGRTVAIPISVGRQDGPAKITEIRVQVSFDDGKTWRPVKVRRHGAGWLLTVRHPVAGLASLRATAADANGNQIRQTIVRAYRVTAPSPTGRTLADMSGATPVRYAYLGPEGTFTEAALRTIPGADEAELIPCATVPAALDAVRSGEADGAVVPIENSVEGAVPVTLDELAGGHLVIIREVLLHVSFALLARPGTELDAVKRIATHPHAAAQTRRWVAANLPLADVQLTSSTAAAAAAVAEPGSAFDAAIAPPIAAGHYGLVALAEEIEDTQDAVTRFVLAARPRPVTAPTGADKTSLVAFIRDDHPGALLEILEEFSVRGVNLTRIESRPTGDGLGRYCFSIDCEGHLAEARVGEALMGLRRVCADVRYLGSYPRADGTRVTLRAGTTDEDFRGADAWLAALKEGRTE